MDFSATFIAQTVTKRFYTSVGKIFHLVNSYGPTWRQIVAWISKFGIDIGLIPMEEWIQMLVSDFLTS